MADSEPVKCVLCSDNASPRVIKDALYQQMLALLWDTLKIDVKFTEIEKFDICASCFGKAVDFYDLNDSCVIMEGHMATLTKELVTSNLAGIKKMKDAGKQCLDPHLKFEQEYPGLQPRAEDSDKMGYKYDLSRKLETIGQSEKCDDDADLDATKHTTITFKKFMDSSHEKNPRKVQHPSTTMTKRPRRKRNDTSDDSD